MDPTLTVALTDNNLTGYCHRFAHLWDDPNTACQAQRDQSKRIEAALQSLGINLPKDIVNKVVASFCCMIPMERHLVEQGGYQLEEHGGERDPFGFKSNNDDLSGAGVLSSGNSSLVVEARSETRSVTSP